MTPWIAARPSPWGLALLAPSALVHVLATWWHINFISGFAMLVTVWGLVWTLWGGRVLWALRFPLLFLAFMVPLPGVVLIAVSFKMNRVVAAEEIAAQAAGERRPRQAFLDQHRVVAERRI